MKRDNSLCPYCLREIGYVPFDLHVQLCECRLYGHLLKLPAKPRPVPLDETAALFSQLVAAGQARKAGAG